MRIFPLVCCLFVLSACTLDKGSSVLNFHEEYPATETAMPAAPPPPVPEPTPMDLFRAMAPPEGPKFTPLFDKPAADNADRMKRLEDSVQSLKNDFDTVVPAITQMMADQKQAKQQQAAAASAVAAAPQSLTPAAAAPAPVPVVQTVGTVKGIRFSDDKDMTRVVLDMTTDDNLTAQIENNGKTLVINMPRMKWSGSKSWDANNAQLISGYRMDNGKLSVSLMYAASIKTQMVIPPGPKNSDHRLVIDLFSPDVHK